MSNRSSGTVHISDRQNVWFTRKQCWEESPSAKDGFDNAQLAGCRKQNQNFLKRLVAQLKLGARSPGVENVALVYIEKFFARRSYKNNERYLIVAAACFLAAKAQDAMRLSWAKQVAGAYFEVKNANKPAELQAFKQDPDRKLAELNLVNGLLLAERAILFTLNFDMRDYALKGHLKSYLVALGVASAARQGGSPAPAPANELKEDQKAALMQIINVFATHIYKTPVVVQYPPCKVVVALVGEAVKRLGLQLAPLSDDHLTALAREFEGSIFTVTEAENKDIVEQMLDQFKEVNSTKTNKQIAQAANETADGSGPAASGQPPAQPAKPASTQPQGTTNTQQPSQPQQPAQASQPTSQAQAAAAPTTQTNPHHPFAPVSRPLPRPQSAFKPPPPRAPHPAPAPVLDDTSPPERVPGVVWNDDHNNFNVNCHPPAPPHTQHDTSPEEGEIDEGQQQPTANGVSSVGSVGVNGVSAGAASRKRSAEPESDTDREAKVVRVA